MEKSFSCRLRGGQWWEVILGNYAIALTVQITSYILSIRLGSQSLEYMLYSYVQMFVLVIVSAIFSIWMMRSFLPSVSFSQKDFAFSGRIVDYIKINLAGLFFTVITLGIYGPWYLRRQRAYLAQKTSYDGHSFAFMGRGGTFLKYSFLFLFLPLVGYMVVFIMFFAGMTYASPDMGSFELGAVVFIGLVPLLVIASLFGYYSAKWMIDYQWRDLRLQLAANQNAAMNTIMLQLFLSFISLGIYLPAAMIKLYRFIIENVDVRKEGRRVRKLGFTGSVSEGFVLIWKQILLTVVTLGIYLPWALANYYRWFVGNITVTKI